MERLAAEIQESPSYYDHEFYFNPLKKAFNLFLYIMVLAGAGYLIWQGMYIYAGLLVVPFAFLLPIAIKEFRDKEPQIKIAEKGIWLKDSGFNPWGKIQKIHIRKDRSGKSEVAKLEIFLLHAESKNADLSVEINELKQWKDIGIILQSMGKTEVENDY